MKRFLLAALAALMTITALATTLILEPGDGRQYLGYWCGGQTVNEVAEGFTDAGVSTIVRVMTTCSTGGRGSLPKTYFACWRVGFSPDGVIVSQEQLNSGSWRKGSPVIECEPSPDPSLDYTQGDATLSTALLGSTSPVYRAILEIP